MFVYANLKTKLNLYYKLCYLFYTQVQYFGFVLNASTTTTTESNGIFNFLYHHK